MIQGDLFQEDINYPSWMYPNNWKTKRWKTAIARKNLSVPLRCALSRLPSGSWLDFGCGRSHDVDNLSRDRPNVHGFDPYWKPDFSLLSQTWQIVSCIYVLNVIESQAERIEVLQYALHKANAALVIAARCDGSGEVITSIDTFQKYFTASEFLDFLKLQIPASKIDYLRAGVAIIWKK